MSINSTYQPRELLSQAIDWQEQGERVALITLVNIEGNAPYPVGSQMLVNDEGNYIGQITGGCAEVAIADQAVAAIRSGKDAIQRYGTGSPFFDIQLPCGSGIDVFIDTSTPLAVKQSMQMQLVRRQAVIQKLVYENTIYLKTYLPNERLIIFGQGPILTSLASMAQQTGFDVICYAQNNESEEALAAAGIQSKILNQGAVDFDQYCDQYTALVSLFHEHEHEVDILTRALTTNLFYIGALGSRRTHAERLKTLRACGFDERLLEGIRGPVGMDIGANTPTQIAISILSDLIAVMNKIER